MQQHGSKQFYHRSQGPTLGDGVKIEIFQNVVMLHVKLKGIMYGTIFKHRFFPYAHPRPLGKVNAKTCFFSDSNHVADKIN